MDGLLKAASEAVNKGALFSEFGSGQEAGGVEGRLEGIAKGIQEKNPDLTYEQAFDRALQQNPDLYTEYVTEQGA